MKHWLQGHCQVRWNQYPFLHWHLLTVFISSVCLEYLLMNRSLGLLALHIFPWTHAVLLLHLFYLLLHWRSWRFFQSCCLILKPSFILYCKFQIRSAFAVGLWLGKRCPSASWRWTNWYIYSFSVQVIISCCLVSKLVSWGLRTMCRCLESMQWSFVNLKRVWICLSLHTKHLYSYNLKSTSWEAQHWHFWPKSWVEMLLRQNTSCFN